MNKNVILYTIGCPECEILKKKLDKKGIDYTEVTSVDEMLSLGINAVPVLRVDDVFLKSEDVDKWLMSL